MSFGNITPAIHFLLVVLLAVRPFLNPAVMPMALAGWFGCFLTLWLWWFFLPRDPVRPPAMIFLLPLGALLAALPAAVYPLGAQITALRVSVSVLLCYYLCGQSGSLRRLSVIGFLTAGTIMSMIALYQYGIGFPCLLQEQGNSLQAGASYYAWEMIHQRRVTGAFSSPGSLSAFLAVTVTVGTGYALVWSAARRFFGAAAAGIIAVLGGCALFATHTVSSLASVALTAAGALFGIVSGDKKTLRLKWTLGIAVVLCIGLTAAALYQRREFFFNAAHREHSVRHRLHYWKSAVDMWEQRVLLGWGPGSFWIVYPQFKCPQANETRSSHNSILQSLSETGLVGTAMTAFFLLWCVWQLMRRPGGPEQWVWAAATVVFSMDSLFNPCYAVAQTSWVFWFCLGMTLSLSPAGTVSAESPGPAVRSGSIRALGAVAFTGLLFSFLLVTMIAHYNQAQVLFRDNRPQAALDQLRRSVNWLPSDMVFLRMAECAAAVHPEFSPEAESYFKQAILSNPLYAYYYFYLSCYYARHNRPLAAAEYLERATERYPQEPLFHSGSVQSGVMSVPVKKNVD